MHQVQIAPSVGEEEGNLGLETDPYPEEMKNGIMF